VAVDVTVEHAIAAPREQVAALAMDPRNDRRWIGALTEVNQLTDGPVGPGTRVERIARFLGRRITYVNEITELEPGRRLAMRSIEAPFPLQVTYEFEDAPGGGTLARIRTSGDTGRYYAFAGPLLATMVRRGVARDLRRLEHVLE